MTATPPRGSLTIRQATVEDGDLLREFAARRPLAWNDYASVASMPPGAPRVWMVLDGDAADPELVAASIDDGLAMGVAGDPYALTELARHVPDLDDKLVIAGRREEVLAFVDSAPTSRTRRDEHFMAVQQHEIRTPFSAVDLRIAERSDLPMLEEVRAAALEEEYGITVDRSGSLYGELVTAVRRAVDLQGVAIWVDEGRCAFTAQLISKTPVASMFGDLYTDPALRGEGRATRALTAFCTWLMTESTHVTLRVGVENTPAVRLYERVGFTVRDAFCSSLGAASPGA